MKTANKTDVGLIRKVNEDRAVVLNDVSGFTLAIVADGMGGHQAGDVASQIAVDTVQSYLQSLHSGMNMEELMHMVGAAVVKANEDIYNFASSKEQFLGMGTTIVVVLVAGNEMVVAHIGDSRAYIFSGETIRQLTDDHSYVNELVKSGQISSEEAVTHPRKNLVTRAVGTEQHVEVDIQAAEWKAGDVVLLCSDGLSDFVNEDEMIDIMRTDNDLEWKVNRLVSKALEVGGNDNVTVILLSNEPDATERKG